MSSVLNPAASAEFVVLNADHVTLDLLGVNKLADQDGFDLLDPNTYQHITESDLKFIFRSANGSEIPLFNERLRLLHEAGKTLVRNFNGSFINVINQCDKSALKLLDLVCEWFPSFRDCAVYRGQQVSFLKRAQILVGDLWSCFGGKGWGEFYDIDEITAFADYRYTIALV
ncbi:hypothetical protein AHF37_12218 [Paragonimus kellicotti]|nr:hypothetical protein AHF37_12217 [Paragonimus kellicotti]KAF6769680.1 hypothetical protein AHF37_12218 [Paragonimus kellicotti]